MKLQTLATLAAGLSIVLAACSCSSESEAPRNVILVTLDTTRPDFFGSWGSDLQLTPRMDALAAEGARFSMTVSASAVTPVSHASILTGQLPYQHGLRILSGPSGYKLPQDVPTLATTLKARGYTTAAIHSAFPVSRLYGFDKDFDIYQDMSNVALEDKEGGSQGWDVTKGQRRSDETTDMVLDFLNKTEEPFFLWIHYWDPHDLAMLPDKLFMTDNPVQSEQGSFAWWREVYGIEISYVDREFGRVIDSLQASGRYDETLIAIISDHGEGLDDGEERHGWRAHRILYQEQIHVPLIVRIPGGPSGVVVDQLTRSIDVFPTLLDYLDVAPLKAVEGRSLRGVMEGRSEEAPVAYADQINLWDGNAAMVKDRPKADFLHVAMGDKYKLIYRPSYPEDSELYDFRKDPGELVNLFHDEQFREPRVRLLSDLAERAGWVLEPFPKVEGEGMSEKDNAVLDALGYTGSEDGTVADALWEWLCPVDWTRQEDSGPCPNCNSACLPAAKPRE